MITYEIVSPSELKNDTIEITYGLHKSPFGWCLIGITKRGICQISFVKTNSEREAIQAIHNTWPQAKPIHDQIHTKSYIEKIFSRKKLPERSKLPFHLLIKGTNFQIKVWEALLKIPQGETKSYGEVARAIKSPKAVRAVGTACGKNAIAYLIPCHRVITTNGGIGGYHWGVNIKKELLAAEKVK